MTPAQVEEANGAALEDSSKGSRLYEPEPGLEGRYRTLEFRSQKFLGRTAEVSYTFLDDKLFSYHVFTADLDGDALEADMRRYLVRQFGSRYDTEQGPPLRILWQFKDRIVNYWFYGSGTESGYRAGYGVLYKPLEKPAS